MPRERARAKARRRREKGEERRRGRRKEGKKKKKQKKLASLFLLVNKIILCPSIFLVDLPNPTQFFLTTPPPPTPTPSALQKRTARTRVCHQPRPSVRRDESRDGLQHSTKRSNHAILVCDARSSLAQLVPVLEGRTRPPRAHTRRGTAGPRAHGSARSASRVNILKLDPRLARGSRNASHSSLRP